MSSDQPWLTTASQPGAWSGNDSITYSVAANSSGVARNGRLTVRGGSDSLQITITQPGTSTSCAYSLTQSTQSVSSSGATPQVGVIAAAGCGWSALSDQSWLTITVGSSGSGNAAISYAVAANTSTTARTGHIIVSGNGGAAQLTVTQSGVACSYTLSPTATSVTAAGGSAFTATLTAGCAWTASSDQPAWLTITSGTSGSASATITYAVAANTSATSRTGIITVTGSGGTAQLTVNQSGSACTYTLSPTTQSVSGSRASFRVSVTAGCSWNAASDQSWLTITVGSSGSGNGSINYDVAENEIGGARTGHITVSGSGGSVQLTVSQAACTYSLSPSTELAPASGGSFSTVLTTACNWSAAKDQPWLTITGVTDGSGNATISYTVAPNTSQVPRTGHITVTNGIDESQTIRATLTVDQKGVPAIVYKSRD